MGKAKPATKGDLLEEMTTVQRQTFKRIERLFDEAEHNFAWHHRLGGLLLELREGETHLPRGWMRRLAERLSRSPSLLSKSVTFAEQYTAEEAAELDTLDVGWDRLVQTLAIEDKADRLALLQDAKGQSLDWLRREVKRARGVEPHAGGRPRRALAEGQEVESLLELLGRSKRWLDYAGEDNWQGEPPQLFEHLQAHACAEDAGLLERLKELDELLGQMGQSVARLQKSLLDLLATLKRRAKRRK
jgi:hypothetical protein